MERDIYFFYDRSEYRQMRRMLEVDSRTFLWQELERTRAETESVRLEIDRLTERRDQQQSELEDLKEEIGTLKMENREEAELYRLGHMITWPGRKLRRLTHPTDEGKE